MEDIDYLLSLYEPSRRTKTDVYSMITYLRDLTQSIGRYGGLSKKIWV
jgi:hypothetical protein